MTKDQLRQLKEKAQAGGYAYVPVFAHLSEEPGLYMSGAKDLSEYEFSRSEFQRGELIKACDQLADRARCVSLEAEALLRRNQFAYTDRRAERAIGVAEMARAVLGESPEVIEYMPGSFCGPGGTNAWVGVLIRHIKEAERMALVVVSRYLELPADSPLKTDKNEEYRAMNIEKIRDAFFFEGEPAWEALRR